MNEPVGIRVVAETTYEIDIDVGISAWQRMDSNRYILEEDYKVSGDIWRVHLNDADPFPSKPHAHCVGGTKRFVGMKLHLGTGQLFDSSNKPLNRRLAQGQFERLIELVRPKFPTIDLPLRG
jgi:hypothetical protein